MNKLSNRVLGGVALAAAVSALSLPASAAIDIGSAIAGVNDAQDAVLGVLAVMITMAAAIFGTRKVLKLMGR